MRECVVSCIFRSRGRNCEPRPSSNRYRSSFKVMSKEEEQPGRFEPLHNAHSIEQVAFTVQFSGSLDDTQLSAVKEICFGFSELPARVALVGMTVGFAAGTPPPFGVLPSGQQNALAGYVCRRIQPNGSIEAELQVDRTSVTFRTSIYSRWDETWSNAKLYFERIVPIYSLSLTIASIALNYVDKFVWSGPEDECKADYLLRSDSLYISNHILTLNDLWHSHTGAFLKKDEYTKRLLNINLDCLDEADIQGTRRVVAITTVLTDMFNQTGYQPSNIGSDMILTHVAGHLNDMHIFDKYLLGRIINAEMCKRIGLEECL